MADREKMRLIDADALLEYCNNLQDKTIDANDIARFPTASGWISVKDRLPEATRSNGKDGLVTSDDVLVCLCKDNGKRYIIIDSYAESSVVIDSHVVKYSTWLSELTSKHLMVTHWMPLPELPKEEAATGEEV